MKQSRQGQQQSAFSGSVGAYHRQCFASLDIQGIDLEHSTPITVDDNITDLDHVYLRGAD